MTSSRMRRHTLFERAKLFENRFECSEARRPRKVENGISHWLRSLPLQQCQQCQHCCAARW